VGNALPNIERSPKEGEEARAGAEAIVGITGEVVAERPDESKKKRDPSTTVGPVESSVMQKAQMTCRGLR
jgi:hypothetical protein